VELRLDAPLPRLRSFARWLAKHALLVKSIIINEPTIYPAAVDGMQWALHLEAAQLLLQQALQLATALPAAAAATTEAAAAVQPLQSGAEWGNALAQHQHQQQRPLCLPNIGSITMAGNVGMLAALPAHSLTHLRLTRLLGLLMLQLCQQHLHGSQTCSSCTWGTRKY
jgi:hypothetical protein